jgi:hypothetical protein
MRVYDIINQHILDLILRRRMKKEKKEETPAEEIFSKNFQIEKQRITPNRNGSILTTNITDHINLARARM